MRFGKPGRHRAVGRRLLRLGLLHLMWREVELVLLVEDGFPREELSCSLVQVLQARFISREKDDSVSVEARGGAAGLENWLCRCLGSVVCAFAVCVVDAEDDESSVKVVRDIGTGARNRMHAIEVSHLA